MASTTETGFGARLRRARDLMIHLNSLTVYNPPRPQESISALSALIAQLEQLNEASAIQSEQYLMAADLRQQEFRTDPLAVLKLLSPVYGTVVSQFGKSSKEAEITMDIIKKLRGTKLTKAPADPTAPKGNSQSESSYGSMTKLFSDLVSTLSQFSNYDPSNASLKVAALQQKAADLTLLSDDITAKAGSLRATRKQRLTHYEDLSERAQRIKAYLKAEYGVKSDEYAAVKGLNL